jgi:adenylate kinase
VTNNTLERVATRIVLVGRQGSGKGEQCRRLAARLGAEHISTGELLRAAAAAQTPLGRQSERYLVRGVPVPDDLVAGVVAERVALASAEGRGVVLDGYPRSVAQADRLVTLLAPDDIDVVVHLDVPRSIAVLRIENRRICTVCGGTGSTARCTTCGGPTTRRADDWPDAIGRRMSDYARELAPLLQWCDQRGILETVDGIGTPEAVEERIRTVVDRRLRIPA